MPDIVRLPALDEPLEVTIDIPASTLETRATATIWTDLQWARLSPAERDRRAVRIEGYGWISFRATLKV